MSLDLLTERLVLRPLCTADTAALFAIFSDPLTVQFTEWEPFKTIADAEWLVWWAMDAAQQEPRSVFAWGIHQRDTDSPCLLGVVTLTRRNGSARQASIGYIMDRSVWGRGIATEAAGAVIEWGFRTLRLHRVAAECHPDNTGSVRVLEKIGMRREGCLRQNKWEKNQWRDTALFALLESDFCTNTSD